MPFNSIVGVQNVSVTENTVSYNPNTYGALSWWVAGDTVDRASGATLTNYRTTLTSLNGYNCYTFGGRNGHIKSPTTAVNTSNSWTICMAFDDMASANADVYLFAQCAYITSGTFSTSYISMQQTIYTSYSSPINSTVTKCNYSYGSGITATSLAYPNWDQCVVSFVYMGDGANYYIYVNSSTSFTQYKFSATSKFETPKSTLTYTPPNYCYVWGNPSSLVYGNAITYPTATHVKFRAGAFFDKALSSSQVQSMTMASFCGRYS